jgi:diacylglycerol kinase (ATP)
VANWSIADVSRWLSASNLGQYRETFESHEISGRELIRLERSDLKDLGVVKVGHIKRIQVKN